MNNYIAELVFAPKGGTIPYPPVEVLLSGNNPDDALGDWGETEFYFPPSQVLHKAKNIYDLKKVNWIHKDH